MAREETEMASFDCAKPTGHRQRERDLFDEAARHGIGNIDVKMKKLTKMLAGEGPRVARMVAFDQFERISEILAQLQHVSLSGEEQWRQLEEERSSFLH